MFKSIFLVYLCLFIASIASQAPPGVKLPKLSSTMPGHCGMMPFNFDNQTHSCAFTKKGQCKKIMLIVTGLQKSSGVGVHFSSTEKLQRETTHCYIHSKNKQATLRCYQNRGGTDDEVAEVVLGNQRYVESVNIAVSRGMVRVSVNKITVSYQVKKNKVLSKKRKAIPYVVEATIPIDITNGFCSSKTFYFKANNALFPIQIANDVKRHLRNAGRGYNVATFLMNH